MKYTAYCYIVGEGKSPQPANPDPVFEFEAESINEAKEQVTLYCQNHKVMSHWYKLDPISKWQDMPKDSEIVFARKTFRVIPKSAGQKVQKTYVELLMPNE